MALYAYDCSGCGPFQAWRPMAEAAAPCPCPACEAPAARALASPHTRNSRSSLRYFAETRNERSGHEPMLERRLKAGTGAHDHHGHGRHRHETARAGRHRPWMIGH